METTMTSDVRSTELARKMYQLRLKKQEIENKVKDIDAELDQVKLELTKIMEDLGVQKFALDGIGTFYLAVNVYPKILDDNQLISWLDANNLSTIAPRKVHVPSLREMFEQRLQDDQPVPTNLVDMTPQTSVRLRASKKGASNE
jgi:hypothetical protein